ncbi:MAG: ATP-binding protein [Oculatellaceae cyanobacterium Prado106]|jgi:signal transduction histidine kinase|nr:ATP-binding protein [Oculatellaceae cyanobacterium Prado106]
MKKDSSTRLHLVQPLEIVSSEPHRESNREPHREFAPPENLVREGSFRETAKSRNHSNLVLHSFPTPSAEADEADRNLSGYWGQDNLSQTSLSQTSLSPTDTPTDLPTEINPIDLSQIILASSSPQQSLLLLSKTLTEAFQVDCCVIQTQETSPTLTQTLCWSPQPLPVHFGQQFSQLLHLPQVQDQWQADQLVVSTTQSSLSSPTQPSDAIPHLPHPASQDTRPPRRPLTALRESTTWGSKTRKLEFPFQSILALRTRIYGQINGIVCLMRFSQHEWKEQDVKSFESLSPQVAIAISQAQLTQKVQQQLRYQTLNDQLTAAIRSGWELPKIFELAVEGTTTALGASRGLLLLLKYQNARRSTTDAKISLEGEAADSGKSAIAPEAEASIVFEYPQACQLNRLFSKESADGSDIADLAELSEDIQLTSSKDGIFEVLPESSQGTWVHYCFQASSCGLCRKILGGSANPVVLPTLPGAAEPGVEAVLADPAIAPFFQLEHLPSVVLMPLEHQGMMLGTLVLQDQSNRHWSEEELSFIKLIAAQLSTAIIQARTLQKVQSVITERTAQLQRSLEVQAKLYEKTRQQVDQLQKLHEEREEFLSTVSHELLTPLTSMSLAIRMLRQAQLTPERQARYLDILEQQCQQETQLINDMLALRKLENEKSTAQPHKIDLRYLIRDLVDSSTESWRDRGLTLHLDLPSLPLTIFSDPDSLNRILAELLNNARKYADLETQVSLKVIHQVTDSKNEIVMTLRSTGLGIEPDEIPCIFDKFRRGRVATKLAIQGTGLGLTLVKRLVEHVNGAIAVTSQPHPRSDSWDTCFTISLPPCPEGVVR